jgi:glycosyltransferase involved in cell wall biosynthesis
MNDLLSFGIPTYNRAEMLDEALAYFFDELDLYDFQLFISDNCSTDNTIQVINKYASRYNNIQYFIQNENTGADKNMVFLQDHCNTEYFMLLGDGVRLFKSQLYNMIDILKDEKYDAILFNYNSRIKIKSKLYTDRNAILEDLGWAITQMSSYILSRRIIFNTKISDIYFKSGSEFQYYSRIFDYLAERECCNVYWYAENCLTFSSIPKKNSWHKRFMSVWMGQYVETILSLPITYRLESKLFCLKSYGCCYLFQLITIVNLIIDSCITASQVFKFRKHIPYILRYNWKFYYVLCLFPKSLLELFALIYRITRKVYRIARKILNIVDL